MRNNSLPTHKAGEKCFACSPERDKGGRLVLVPSKFSTVKKYTFYLVCSRAPDCKNRVPAKQTEENNFKMSTRAKITHRMGK